MYEHGIICAVCKGFLHDNTVVEFRKSITNTGKMR